MKEKKAINVEVGARIQRSRERAGLTQDALAERVGLEPKSISAIERGVVGASLTTLKGVCEALHISSDALLFGADGENGRTRVGAACGFRPQAKGLREVFPIFVPRKTFKTDRFPCSRNSLP